MTKQELITFEDNIKELWEAGKIHCPVHFCGGNESKLIKIFDNIKKTDYVFSTHRNHLHYLLHTGNRDFILKNILSQNEMGSMHTIDHEHHFYSSAIVAGCVSMAVGVAWALKQKKSRRRVHILLGDGAFDSGFTYEAIRYAQGFNLPIKFYYEDNDRSVVATKKQRWGNLKTVKSKVYHYRYKIGFPHCGTNVWVNL